MKITLTIEFAEDSNYITRLEEAGIPSDKIEDLLTDTLDLYIHERLLIDEEDNIVENIIEYYHE